jgi:hypothetical protein
MKLYMNGYQYKNAYGYIGMKIVYVLFLGDKTKNKEIGIVVFFAKIAGKYLI